MTVRSTWRGLAQPPVAAVVALAACDATATLLAQWLGHAPAWQPGSPLHVNAGLALLVGCGWAARCAVARGAAERRRWLAAMAAMLLLAVVEASDTALAGVFGFDDDWLPELPLWIAAMALLGVALRQPPAAPWARHAWRAGVAVQTVFMVCDHAVPHAAGAGAAALVEGLELLTIECYVVAIVLAGSGSARAPVATLAGRVRSLYCATRVCGRARLLLAAPAARHAFGDGASFVGGGAATRALFDDLARMRSLPLGGRELRDALLFDACCRRNGLPVPRLLLVCDAAGSAWQAPRSALDTDLRCVPVLPRRSGHGDAATHWHRVDHERYAAADGSIRDLDRLLAGWQRRGRAAPLLVQALPRGMRADAAPDVVRVMTCLDAAGRPVVTHAVLLPQRQRQRQPGAGAAIDLASGRVDDGGGLVACPAWPAVGALALAAHRAFRDCTVLDWRIAAAADGPLLLGASDHPDLALFEAAHRQGVERSPLGPLLRHHVDALARAHGVATAS